MKIESFLKQRWTVEISGAFARSHSDFKSSWDLQHTTFPALLALTICFIAGCSEEVNPLVEEPRPFTVYGYLDPTSSLQVVRVFPIGEKIQELADRPLDAVVTTYDLATGEQHNWKDSLVTFVSGEQGHIFVARFMPAYERSYRLEVTRSDGVTSRATVTVPSYVRLAPPPLTISNTIVPFVLETTAEPNIVQAEMRYLAAALQPPTEPGPIFHPVNISYRGEEKPAASGLQIEVDVREDYRIVQAEFDRNCLTTEFIAVRKMDFVVFIGDEAWVPPGNVFDPEVLVEPGLFSNIENGLGFFGAGYAIRFNAIQRGPVLQRAGFVTEEGPCSDVPPDDPSCRVIPPCFG